MYNKGISKKKQPKLEGHSVERMYTSDKGQNPKIGQVWRPVAPQPYVVQKSRETPWPLDYNVEETVSLQCISWSVAWSEWGACLTDFDRSSISIFDLLTFQIFRFRHPDYDSDRAQKLISSSMSRHLSTRKISSKSMHAFFNNLANRQTDRHRGQSHILPPLSQVIN